MKQCWVHIVFLMLILAVGVSLILVESQRAHKEISDSVEKAVSTSVVKAADRAADRAVDRAVDRAGDLIGSVLRGDGAVAKKAENIASVVLGGGQATGKAEPGGGAKTQPQMPATLDPVSAVGSIARIGTEVAHGIDNAGQQAFGLTPKEDLEAGREVHRLMLCRNRVVNDPVLHQRLERLIAPLLDQRRRKEIDYKLAVLDTPVINASSHLGGYLYINRGLIEHTQNDAELQFVLGHELAHVDIGHCSHGMTYAARAAQVVGSAGATIVQQAYHMVALGYSEDQELEADAWSFRALRKAGRTSDEAICFMKRQVGDEAAKTRPARPREQPASLPDAVVAAIEGHFASHPPTSERLERLQSLAAEPGSEDATAH